MEVIKQSIIRTAPLIMLYVPLFIDNGVAAKGLEVHVVAWAIVYLLEVAALTMFA